MSPHILMVDGKLKVKEIIGLQRELIPKKNQLRSVALLRKSKVLN